MKRRSLENWKQLIEQQTHSGLNIVDFCKQQKLTTSSFYKYKNRLKPVKRFLKAEVSTQVKETLTPLILVHGNAQLNIPHNCSASWLANLIKALQL